jgi:hypothetical protein
VSVTKQITRDIQDLQARAERRARRWDTPTHFGFNQLSDAESLAVIRSAVMRREAAAAGTPADIDYSALQAQAQKELDERDQLQREREQERQRDLQAASEPAQPQRPRVMSQSEYNALRQAKDLEERLDRALTRVMEIRSGKAVTAYPDRPADVHGLPVLKGDDDDTGQ